MIISFSLQIQAQITIESNTLPEPGDVLSYTTFSNYPDTLSFKATGENLNWSYSSFDLNAPLGTVTEVYAEIAGTELMDSFPDANMILNIMGFEAAAIKTENAIEVIGLSEGAFGEFGVEANIALDEPYIYRQTPLNYNETYKY